MGEGGALKISVVIGTRDRPGTVGQTVESVAACDHPSFDVHVVDQSADTLTRGLVEGLAARLSPRCRVHYHHLDTAGLSRACNAGLRLSDGDVLAFTDDDVVVPADWLGKIARAFEDDPRVGLLYGQVLVPDSLADACRGGAIEVPSVTFQRRELLVGRRHFRPPGMGANMAIRRDVLERVGGFDEALGGGGPLRSSQDHDIALRAYRLGIAILRAPDVRVEHYGARTRAQWPQTLRNYGVGDGAFYWKHIRCGDALALRLFLEALARGVARQVRSLVTRGRWHDDPYALSLFRGVRDASRFAVDRDRRLFRQTSAARAAVTEPNPVTTIKHQD